MSYWASDPDGNDFAFDAIGVNIMFIKDRMLQDMKTVKAKQYPEQSIISSLICLRLIGERFPEALSVHFKKRDFEKSKTAFYEWFNEVESNIPKKYRISLLEEAEAEFQLFEERIFTS